MENLLTQGTLEVRPAMITGRMRMWIEGSKLKVAAHILTPDGPQNIAGQVDLLPIMMRLRKWHLEEHRQRDTVSGEDEFLVAGLDELPYVSAEEVEQWGEQFGQEEFDIVGGCIGCPGIRISYAGRRPVDRGVHGWIAPPDPRLGVRISGIPIIDDIARAAKNVGRSKLIRSVAKTGRGIIRSKVTGAVLMGASVAVPAVGVPALGAYVAANRALDTVDRADRIKRRVKRGLAKAGLRASVRRGKFRVSVTTGKKRSRSSSSSKRRAEVLKYAKLVSANIRRRRLGTARRYWKKLYALDKRVAARYSKALGIKAVKRTKRAPVLKRRRRVTRKQRTSLSRKRLAKLRKIRGIMQKAKGYRKMFRRIAKKSRLGDPNARKAAEIIAIAAKARAKQKVIAARAAKPGDVVSPGILVTNVGNLLKGQFAAVRPGVVKKI